MSIITCTECGTGVSTSAKACPGCGASPRVLRRASGKKPIDRKGKIIIATLAAATVIGLGSPQLMGSTAPPPKSAEELASDSRMRAAYLAVNALRASLREPESALFEKVGVDESAATVCLIYRARNGFGGMSRERVVFVDGDPSQRTAVWNKHCARSSLYDLTKIARL